MTDKLYRVLYCSRMLLSREPKALDAEVSQILAASRRNNASSAITGGLLFSEGCFAQVLEGPADAVAQTFERIQCDSRHREVTVLEAGVVPSRYFPDWSMGFSGTASLGHLPAASSVAACVSDAMSGDAGRMEEMLDMMRAVIVREDDRLVAT